MKISILTPNLSYNCVGRAYMLAKILQRNYKVEIAGMFDGAIWNPVADDKSIEYRGIEKGKIFNSFSAIPELLKNITGDIIYASKPVFESFDAALLKKIFSKKPVILDIDDWQLGSAIYNRQIIHSLNWLRKVRYVFHSMKNVLLCPTDSCLWMICNEKLTRFADQITTSNSFLHERFGGTIVWHARDTNYFDPAKFDKISLREKYNIGKFEQIVLFCGTPRPHKGIEDLIEALKKLKDVILIIVGEDEYNYGQEIIMKAKREIGRQRIREFGFQSFSKIPEFLAISDVVVIPQRKNQLTLGQVPAKIFDAMAMAKPIVATRISDMPKILENCGWIAEPDNPQELADAIDYIFNHPSEASEKGRTAREKCKINYSYDAMEKVLENILKVYE